MLKTAVTAAWPRPRCFAHRCGGVLAPENTLAGLDAAVVSGAKGVEFDVMLSGSGSPVLIHDETLSRTTNGQGRVAETEDEALFALDAGGGFGASFAGTRVPALQAALARCLALNLDVNLEIKPSVGQDQATARIAVQTALRVWPTSRPPPLLSSFSEAALMIAADIAPTWPRGLLFDEAPADWLVRCRNVGASSVHLNTARVTADLAIAIRRAGLWLVVYTENDPVAAERLFALGVDCIITDRPDLLCAIVGV